MQLTKLLQVCLLPSLVVGIVLEKAFTQEHLTHLIRDVGQLDTINADSIVGLGNDQFLNVDISQKVPQVIWSIDLRETDLNQYHLLNKKSLAYLFSNISLVLSLYETTNGIFQKSLKLDSSVECISEFFNKGVVVLTTKGLVYFIDYNGTSTLLDVKVTQAQFQLQQINGFAYLLFSNKLVKIDPETLAIQTEKSVPFAGVRFKDELVSTSKEVLKFDDVREEFVPLKLEKSWLKGKIPFELVFILDAEHVVVPLKDSVDILKVVGTTLEHSHSLEHKRRAIAFGIITHGLSEYVVVSNENNSKDIYDLTDFLELEDPESIKHIKVTQSRTNLFIEPKDSGLVFITLDNPTEGYKFNLLDGSINDQFKQVQYVSTDDKYLLIDKFHAHAESNTLEESDALVIISIAKRLVRHLSELGKYVVSFVNKSSDSEDEDDYGFGKLIIFFDSEKSVVVGLDSDHGVPIWTAKIDRLAGALTSLIQLNNEDFVALFGNVLYTIYSENGLILSVEKLASKYIGISTVHQDGVDHLVLETKNGFEIANPGLQNNVSDIYLYNSNESELNGFKLSNGKSIKTWKFKKSGENVLKVISKPKNSKSNSLAIALAEKEILYKYLYPNTITVLTRSSTLKIYLIDGITGNVLYEQETDEEIDFDSINLIMDDNWIVYSYLINNEQRINVIDLFDSSKAVAVSTVSSFNYNNTIDAISEKSYIFPEKILSLSSTQSRFGVTVKSILLVTENGKLFELPKYVLNSRRIDDRALTPDDYLSDFKLTPYQPTILADSRQILNHKNKLLIDSVNGVLTKDTHFESTSVVCLFNKYNQFCGVVQPSLSFDLLDKNFSKGKLISTIVVLYVGYLVSNFFVQRKKLREQWIDRQ